MPGLGHGGGRCAAGDSHGGVTDQTNNVGIAHNLAISENVGISPKYYEFLHNQIESYARSRETKIDYFTPLSEERQDIKRMFDKSPSSSEGSSSGYRNYGGVLFVSAMTLFDTSLTSLLMSRNPQ